MLIIALTAAGQSAAVRGTVTAIERRAQWVQNSKADVILSGPRSGVKALIFRIVRDDGSWVDVAQPAGSIFNGFPAPRLTVGQTVEMQAPRTRFWTGYRVTISADSKQVKMFVDAEGEPAR